MNAGGIVHAMAKVSLRPWRESDLEAFAAMNRDPEVMRYFPALLGREESAALMAKHRALVDERGWGLWAVDVDGDFAGFTGLAVPAFQSAFTPCVEIAWRLRREYWGRGIASRAALQALAHGFDTLRLDEIVSFTAAANRRSIRLMERLGFDRDHAGDFDHPKVPEGHELRRHVLYRLSAARHAGRRAAG